MNPQQICLTWQASSDCNFAAWTTAFSANLAVAALKVTEDDVNE